MILRVVGLLLVTLSLAAMGNPEDPRWKGVVSVKGNEPFVFLALVDDQGRQWKLKGPVAGELWKQAQGSRVTVTGQIEGSDAILVRSWVWAGDEE